MQFIPVIALAFSFIVSNLIWILHPSAAHAESVSATDDRGKSIELAAPVQRIISLAPHLTENLFVIGAGDQLVGATQFSNFPDAAKDIERIGTYKNFDFERIVALKPDIVFGWVSGNPGRHIETLEHLGIRLFLTEPKSPEDVVHDLQRLARLTGHPEHASRVTRDYLDKIQGLREEYSGREKVRVFYQVWNQPLITLNGEHIISNLIRGCGGENIFGELSNLAPKVSIESVLARNPDVIIASGMDKSRPEWLDEWKNYSFARAVELNNLYHIHPDLLQRHTIRLAQGMKLMCEHIDRARQKLKS